MINFKSKLPNTETTIFTVMSQLANKHNAINLGQGFPNFDCDAKLKKLISKYLNEGKNQYVPMAGLLDLRKIIAEKANKLYHQNIKPETEITITAGATQAIFTAINAFVNKNDEVIIIEPAYDCYKPTIDLVGAKTVSYQLNAPNFKVDWNEFSKLVNPKTKMIIINTPQNPIGKILGKTDFDELAKIVENTNIIILSDEVYEHIIFDDKTHESVLKHNDLFKRSIAVYSFGKTFHATGWKIGYCIAPDYLMKEFRNIHQWNVFCVNSFIQYALATYLKDENTYLQLPKFYEKKRDYLSNALKNSKLKEIKSEGTYFALYDYSKISNENDIDFAKRICKDFGVATIPISPFYSKKVDSKVVRLCFAKTENVLEQAVVKLNSLLDK